MVGDAEILQAEFLRRVRHLRERAAAVAGGGVTMKGAAQIFLLDQARQAPFRGGFEFAGIFAQLRRDVIQPKSAVEFGLFANFWELPPRSSFFAFAAGSTGAGASRYSLSVQPRWSARLRTTMLCSLLPVK